MKINPLLIILVFLTFKSAAQDPLVTALNERIIKVEPISQSDNFKSFEGFGKLLVDNKILAIGEETHGIKEAGSFRSSLIKYLVSNLNYKSIVLEADFSGVVDLNNYIVNGKGELYKALMRIGTQIFHTHEYLELFEWLRAYNQVRAIDDRVRIYGADMQSTFIALDLKNRSVQLSKNLSSNAFKGLRLLADGLGQKLTKAQKDTVQMLAKEVKDEIALLSDTSFFRQSLKTLIQSVDLITEEFFQYNRSKIRDKAMADNITWIYERDKRKTILLAHNGHIAINPIYSDNKRAGSYLKQTYDKQYYALSFSFFSGQFLAKDEKLRDYKVFDMPKNENKNSSEFMLSQAKDANFILDFRSVSNNKVIDDFLKRKTYSNYIGMTYGERSYYKTRGFMPLIEKFDGLVFFRHTNATSFIRIYDKIKN